MQNSLRALLIASAVMLAVTAAHAQRPAEAGWYAGLSAGRSQIDFGGNFAQVPGATASTLQENNTDFAYKLFAGYRLMRHLALEGGYTNFGHFSATRNVTAPFTGTRTASLLVDGFHFDVVGIFPVSNRIELFGKVGVIRTKTEIDNFATGGALPLTVPAKQKEVNIDPLRLGIGAEFRYTRALALRIEYERQDIDWTLFGESPSVGFASAGLVYRF